MLFFWWFLIADSNMDFVIIPQAEGNSTTGVVQKLLDSEAYWAGEDKASWWDTYNEEADKLDWDTGREWLADQMATGVMNWNTVMNYVVYLVKFLSQIWLVIWAMMMIYAWYIYATWVFTWNATKWNAAIKNAIIGIIVIMFSYALIRILNSMFL